MAVHDLGDTSSHQVTGGFDGFVDWFQPFAELGTFSVIVVENFLVNPGTHKKSQAAFRDTNDIIGALRFHTRTADTPTTFVLQSPAQAKNIVSDDMLRQLGLLNATPGGHANDAMRHLVRYLIHTRDPDTLKALS